MGKSRYETGSWLRKNEEKIATERKKITGVIEKAMVYCFTSVGVCDRYVEPTAKSSFACFVNLQPGIRLQIRERYGDSNENSISK